MSEIQGIIRWPQFGLVLGIEKEIIEKTAQQFGGDEQRALRHIVTNWLDNDPDASWEKLAKAVMRMPMLREKGAQLYTKYVSKGYTNKLHRTCKGMFIDKCCDHHLKVTITCNKLSNY